jgi:hypothetical protein
MRIPASLVANLDMRPWADRQADVDAPASQALVLFDHLINEPVLPSFLQQDGMFTRSNA